MPLPSIRLTGNVAGDVRIRFLPSGAAVADFRVAATDRRFNRNTNAWEDGKTLFIDVEVWRQQAENVAETLHKGMQVSVEGSLEPDEYTDREGVKRTVYKVTNAEVSVSLARQSAQVTKSGGQTQTAPAAQAAQAPAPVAQPAPAAQPAQAAQAAQAAPAAQPEPAAPAAQPAAAQAGTSFLTEPPF